jgi:hypothetical protein
VLFHPASGSSRSLSPMSKTTLSPPPLIVCAARSTVGPNIPFGGYNQSGWGREFGKEGLDLYLDTKAVTVKL